MGLHSYRRRVIGEHSNNPIELFQNHPNHTIDIFNRANLLEVTQHQVTEDIIPYSLWKQLTTPPAMRRAGGELGLRSFFTEMVKVTNLATVPSLPDSIASQYSEGSFATWDPLLEGLVTTVTGSARPVVKDNLSDDELAVIIGIRLDAQGAIVRKSQKSIYGSVLQTLDRVRAGAPVEAYGGERPEKYNYVNGSVIWIGGMDNPDKILSSERDFIYVNQAEELVQDDWE